MITMECSEQVISPTEIRLLIKGFTGFPLSWAALPCEGRRHRPMGRNVLECILSRQKAHGKTLLKISVDIGEFGLEILFRRVVLEQ